MIRRLALTPAIGLFTGLSMMSFGAVSMWLTGVHGSPAAGPCTSKTSTQPGKGAAQPVAYAAPAGRTGAQVRHPAHLPVLLDAAAQQISGLGAARGSSSSPSPSSSKPATPNPTPGGGISPGTGQPAPSPGTSTSAAVGPGHQAGGGSSSVPGKNNPPPTNGGTPTPTSTPTPTPTSTPPPSATLCLSVQTLGGSNTVTEGSTVQFAIFAWLTAGKGGTAKLTLSSSPQDIGPTFSVCAATGGTSCSVSVPKAGQKVEVQAELVAAKDRVGKDITLDVAGTSKQAINSATASDQIQVATKSGGSPTPTPTPTNGNNNPGGGGTLPPANVPGGGGNNSFPGVNQPGSLSSAFPPVSPSANVSPSAPGHGPHHQLKAIDLSAGLPLDVRLIGGQVIGLAILAAAVTIAVARLSLRRQTPRHGGDDGASAGSASASS